MDFESFKETARLKETWSRYVGRGQGVGLTQLTPAIYGDKIYTVDHEGIVTALTNTGKKLWSRSITKQWTGWTGNLVYFFKEQDLNPTISGGISASADALFVGNYAGEVIALSTKDGKELWRKQVKGEIASLRCRP